MYFEVTCSIVWIIYTLQMLYPFLINNIQTDCNIYKLPNVQGTLTGWPWFYQWLFNGMKNGDCYELT